MRQLVFVHERRQLLGKLRLLNMPAREIDGNRVLRHGVLLDQSLADKLGNIPVDLCNEIGFLRDRDEEERGNDGSVGADPAHQCFGAL